VPLVTAPVLQHASSCAARCLPKACSDGWHRMIGLRMLPSVSLLSALTAAIVFGRKPATDTATRNADANRAAVTACVSATSSKAAHAALGTNPTPLALLCELPSWRRGVQAFHKCCCLPPLCLHHQHGRSGPVWLHEEGCDVSAGRLVGVVKHAALRSVLAQAVQVGCASRADAGTDARKAGRRDEVLLSCALGHAEGKWAQIAQGGRQGGPAPAGVFSST
jgi:hypothetical protein